MFGFEKYEVVMCVFNNRRAGNEKLERRGRKIQARATSLVIQIIFVHPVANKDDKICDLIFQSTAGCEVRIQIMSEKEPKGQTHTAVP